MKTTQRNTLSWIIIVAGLALLGLIIWSQSSTSSDKQNPGKYEEFASCLTEKGMVFYGAFWCPHCQDVKKDFGSAFKNIKYIECSTPDRRGQIKFCADKNIEGYPTFEFADGSRISGAVPFSKFSEKTGCPLPAEGTSAQNQSSTTTTPPNTQQ